MIRLVLKGKSFIIGKFSKLVSVYNMFLMDIGQFKEMADGYIEYERLDMRGPYVEETKNAIGDLMRQVKDVLEIVEGALTVVIDCFSNHDDFGFGKEVIKVSDFGENGDLMWNGEVGAGDEYAIVDRLEEAVNDTRYVMDYFLDFDAMVNSEVMEKRWFVSLDADCKRSVENLGKVINSGVDTLLDLAVLYSRYVDEYRDKISDYYNELERFGRKIYRV